MACLTASRVQGACGVAVDPGDGVHNARSASVLGGNGRKPVAQSRAQRGVASEVAVCEIRWRQSCWSAGLRARIFLVAPIHARTWRRFPIPGVRRDENLLCQSAFKIESRPAFSLDGALPDRLVAS
jgi:hypothetical protein